MGDTFRREDQRFRTAARQLAGNRDMEVVARTIASLGGPAEQTNVALQDVSEREMESSRQILSICQEAVETWPLDLHGFHDIAPGFARTYRKTLKAWELVLQEQSDENFHRLRRWAKYHWYHVRILERLNRKKLGKRRKRLRKLQLTLGDAHDFVLVQSFLRPDAEPDAQLLQLASIRKNELYAEAIQICQKLFALPVSVLVADCSRYWSDKRHFRTRCG
jgi:CHAD domain-containing protein